MLRTILFWISTLTLIALGTVALSGHTKHTKVNIGDPRMAGLISCMVKDTCNSRRNVETLSGVEVLSLSTKYKDDDLKIMFKGRAIFGVNVKMSDGRQLVVDDLDLDGLVDLVYIDDGKGVVTSFHIKDEASRLESLLAQQVLDEALQVGWDELVPDEIKNQLITLPPAKSPDLDRFKT